MSIAPNTLDYSFKLKQKLCRIEKYVTHFNSNEFRLKVFEKLRNRYLVFSWCFLLT